MLFLILVLSALVEGVQYFEGYNEEENLDYGDAESGLPQEYNSASISNLITFPETTKAMSLRVRRFEQDTNTFDPDDEDQVKGALNQIFAGRKFNEPLTPSDFTSFLAAEYSNKSLAPITQRINDALALVRSHFDALGDSQTTNRYQPASKYTEEILENIFHNATDLYQYFTRQQPFDEVELNTVDNFKPTRHYLKEQILPSQSGRILKYTRNPTKTTKYFLREKTTDDQNYNYYYLTQGNPEGANPTRHYLVEQILPSRSGNPVKYTRNYTKTAKSFLRGKTADDENYEDYISNPTSATDPTSETHPTSGTNPSNTITTTSTIATTPSNTTNPTITTNPTTESFNSNETSNPNATSSSWPTCRPWPTTTTTTTTTTKKTTLQFDIEKFLEIVANLTYDYYTNLTLQVNETLRKMSMMPTCPTLKPPPTEFDYRLWNDSMRGKCFVCGMDNTGIPFDANCADAFAGDFIPLVPQNPKAKGQIAQFRKYCAFRDISNFLINKTMPRMMWGRWTGGCAVRWTDLSGVYTQRTCRSKFKAAVGKHYASKRMAKLEMALSHTDNGCIISPVATLLPLSRGISLFARFHACVCTGSWCNGTTPLPHVAASLLVAMVTIRLSDLFGCFK